MVAGHAIQNWTFQIINETKRHQTAWSMSHTKLIAEPGPKPHLVHCLFQKLMPSNSLLCTPNLDLQLGHKSGRNICILNFYSLHIS